MRPGGAVWGRGPGEKGGGTWTVGKQPGVFLPGISTLLFLQLQESHSSLKAQSRRPLFGEPCSPSAIHNQGLPDLPGVQGGSLQAGF